MEWTCKFKVFPQREGFDREQRRFAKTPKRRFSLDNARAVMKTKNRKRAPIKIVVAFGFVTKERVEALPDSVKDRIGRVVYGCFVRLAEREAGNRNAVKMAA